MNPQVDLVHGCGTHRSNASAGLYSRRLRRLFLFLCAALLLFSCTKDSGPGGGLDVDTPDQPPRLPVPRLGFEPRINRFDPVGRQAATIVAAQRNMVPYVSRDCESAISTLNGGFWQNAGVGCWSKSLGADPGHGCTYTMNACLEGFRIGWEEEIDGKCPSGFGEETTLDHWTRMLANSSWDARDGTFRVYQMGTSVVENAWAWSLRDNPPGGEWTFYRGQIGAVDPLARLTWTRTSDTLETTTWTWTRFAKWESEIALDGLTGRLVAHRWLPAVAQWRKFDEITWTPGHGTWRTLDSAGTAWTERSW
jgi:hypothetical protein